MSFPPTLLEVPAREPVGDALDRMFQGSICGAIVRGLLPPATCHQLVRRARRLPVTRQPIGSRFPGETLGQGLDHAQPDLAEYFRRQEDFLNHLDHLFGKLRIDELALGLLSRMSRRPVEVAPLGQRRATPVTFRRLPEGGRLPPHVGLEQGTRAPYAQLNEQLGEGTQLSWFLLLQKPPAGGRLRLYDARWEELREEHWYKGRTRPELLLKGRAWIDLPIEAGDALVFDGGRWFHEVTPVQGERWSVGGFMACSADDQRVFIWS